MKEEQYMDDAITLSAKAIREKVGGPFGCVIVLNDKIVGRGWNHVISNHDPTAHAEIVAIRDACRNLQTYQLTDCEIYTSAEPCPMCMAAIYWTRPKKVYYANSKEKTAEAGFDDSYIYEQLKLPIHERSIPMQQVASRKEAAFEVFEEWIALPDKPRY